jgi:sugar lactone lactonase YvrE
MHFCCRAALIVACPAALAAQHPTGFAAADSAAVARAAWQLAGVAMQAHDTVKARREVERAAAAWPTQEGYAWARVVVAGYLRDTNGVLAALSAYANAGFGRDVRADKRFAPYLASASASAIVARVDENRRALSRSHAVATLPDSTFWPEGMDVDPRSGLFYVGSIRHRTIAELSRAGTFMRELLPRGMKGVGAILGVRVDAAHGVLWATTAGLPQMEGYAPSDSSIAAVLRIRLADGIIERRWDLPPSPEGHTLGDLAIGPNGDVFVTDSREPVLYRLRPGADSLERVTHPLFHSLQGIAPTPDGRALYVADWSLGLLRVDLATGRVTRLADAPHSSSLGCDGIALYHGAIIAVQNGTVPQRVMRFTLDAGGLNIIRADVLDRNTAIADEPTIGAIVGDEFVYVANSQWEKYGDDGKRIDGTVLARPVLLAVPLRSAGQ